jgi:hypothetical protein
MAEPTHSMKVKAMPDGWISTCPCGWNGWGSTEVRAMDLWAEHLSIDDGRRWNPVLVGVKKSEFDFRLDWYTKSKMKTPTDIFRAEGLNLPLVPEAFDAFNQRVQRRIQDAIVAADISLALELAQLKLEINRRIYDFQRSKS